MFSSLQFQALILTKGHFEFFKPRRDESIQFVRCFDCNRITLAQSTSHPGKSSTVGGQKGPAGAAAPLGHWPSDSQKEGTPRGEHGLTPPFSLQLTSERQSPSFPF